MCMHAKVYSVYILQTKKDGHKQIPGAHDVQHPEQSVNHGVIRVSELRVLSGNYVYYV